MLSAPALLSLSALLLSLTAPVTAAPRNVLRPLGMPPGQDWQSKQCTDKLVIDAATDPVTRWRELGTTVALFEANFDWSKRRRSISLSYTQEVSNFFHGREGMLCSDVQKGNCDTTMLCSDVSHPAGFLIMNSMVAVHTINHAFYSSMRDARDSVALQVGDFAGKFSPTSDPTAQLKMMLDILGLGLALVAAPVWSSWLKSIPALLKNPNTLGTIKDSVNPMIQSSLTITKDSLPAASQALANQNTLSAMVGKLIDQWLATIDAYNKKLFSGDDEGLAQLTDLIANGRSLDYQHLPDTQELTATLTKTIFGLLMPRAWQVSAAGVHPFLMTPDEPIVGCDGLNPDKYYPQEEGSSAFVCFENRGYWLLNAHGMGSFAAESCHYSKDGPVCVRNKLSSLPGLITVDGQNWGGITRDDIAIGSIKSFQANGNKNGYRIDTTHKAVLDDLIENGVRTAGVVTLPICSGKEASFNRLLGKETPNYPCN